MNFVKNFFEKEKMKIEYVKKVWKKTLLKRKGDERETHIVFR